MTTFCKLSVYLFLLTATVSVSALNVNVEGIRTNKKVLLIGLDGVQLATLKKLDTPNIDKFYITRTYAGGITGTLSEQPTYSGPGWSSILTGVWANKHNIYTNFTTARDKKFPSLFRRIVETYPDAIMGSISSWGAIHDFFHDDLSLLAYASLPENDTQVAQQTLQFMSDYAPDFTFMHLGATDNIAHIFCFGEQYNNAILKADKIVGQIVDFIATRKEDWLVILVTDHGRKANGCHHGGQTNSEKTAFIATNKNKYTPPEPLDNDIYSYPAQTRIADIVLNFLNIPAKPDKSANALRITAAINWSVDTTYFFLNNGYAIKYNKQTDHAFAMEKISDLSWPGLSSYAQHITAALNWSETRALMFLDNGKFLTIDKAGKKVLAVTAINEQNWPGLERYADRISAAIDWSDITAFIILNNGQYLFIDKQKKRILHIANLDNQATPGLEYFAKNISAIAGWSPKDAYIFLQDGHYLKFDRSKYRVIYHDDINTYTWPGI